MNTAIAKILRKIARSTWSLADQVEAFVPKSFMHYRLVRRVNKTLDRKYK